jgi:hypothetical protein
MFRYLKKHLLIGAEFDRFYLPRKKLQLLMVTFDSIIGISVI